MKQVQVAVVGASGYTGQELLRILLNHRGVTLVVCLMSGCDSGCR